MSSSARAGKSKLSRAVILKLSPTQLVKFPHDSSNLNSSSPTPTPPSKESPPETDTKTEIKAEPTNGIGNHLSVPVDGRKRGGGAKAGMKRSQAVMIDGQPKPRGKPGPKKRKLDGVPNGDEAGRPWTTPAPTAGHKLGPKANQGAINAGLRALDRTGKPTRKWTKKTFSLKSFTGIIWEVPTWGAPKKQADLKEEGQSGTPTSNSEGQRPPGSSNVGSETSRVNGQEGPDAMEISEAPDAAASPAVITAAA